VYAHIGPRYSTAAVAVVFVTLEEEGEQEDVAA